MDLTYFGEIITSFAYFFLGKTTIIFLEKMFPSKCLVKLKYIYK